MRLRLSIAFCFLAACVYADSPTAVPTSTATVSASPAATSVAISTPPAAVPAPTPVPVASPAVLPGVMPSTPQGSYNSMTGTIESVDADAGTVRVSVEGGFNVGFSFDRITKMVDNGKPIGPSDLNYGDKVIVRYAGQDLLAIQIERLAQAPAP